MKVRLNRKDDDIYVYTQRRYRYVKTNRIKKKGFKKITYTASAIYLDTETSHTNEVAWIYQWAFEHNDQYVIGRTPSALMRELKRIQTIYHLDDEHRTICYIHNASYDLTYLIDLLEEWLGEYPEILAISNHKILSCVCGGIEFRCSYLLSNMSLDMWSKKLNTKTRKMVGAINYDELHYQDSKLSLTDWEYQINDVQVLKECVLAELEGSNDTLATIPLTSTGYVRRDVRTECQADKSYWSWFQASKLSTEAYKMCQQAFAGGYTHGNRFKVGQTIYGDIGHYDFKSHYPSREELNYFPVDKFVPYYLYDKDDPLSIEELEELCKESCVLMKLALAIVKLREGVTAPMLGVSQADNVNFKFKADNGRILSIYEGIAIYTMTELDYYWLRRQYDIEDIIVVDVYTASRGRCPEPIRKVTDKFFQVKETLSDGYYYMKSKNKLNAIYGCSATNPVRPEVTLDIESGKWKTTRSMSDDDITNALAKFYRSRNNVMPYQIGIYVTAHARNELFHLIADVVGYDNFLYADTDSIFFIKNDSILEGIERYNNDVIARNKELGLGVANRKGTTSYYGTFEDEHDNIKAFRFLHSKCYALLTDEGLKCTIAGVTATNKLPKDDPNFITREQELGEIDALVCGMTFVECGGTRSKYYHHEFTKAKINGHLTEFASGCIIEKVTKTLSSTIEEIEEYEVY